MAIPGKVLNLVLADQLDRQHLVLSWDVVSSTPAPLGYNVYRGDKNDFASATLLQALVPLAQYQVDQSQTLRENKYYFVTCTNADGEGPASDPVSSESSMFSNVATGNMKWIVPEIIRRRNLILTLDGEDGYLMVRKVAGTRCTCWDARRGHGDARCTLCYGTYFLGGYAKVPARIRFYSHNELKISQDLGLSIENKNRVLLGVYPLIHSKDVLVRKNNQRYRVENLIPGVINGVLTRQTVEVKEMEYTDPMYSFPIL